MRAYCCAFSWPSPEPLQIVQKFESAVGRPSHGHGSVERVSSMYRLAMRLSPSITTNLELPAGAESAEHGSPI